MKINEKQKITLTIGQLKRLVKESSNIYWTIFKAKSYDGHYSVDRDDGENLAHGIAHSDNSFNTISDAKKDAIKWLISDIKKPGEYVISCERGWNEIDRIVVSLTKNKVGIIKQ